MHVHLIWAQNKAGVIGVNNKIPWHIPEDLKNFKRLTLGHPIIMGRKTWESLPFKPLPKRRNIVLSKSGFSETESYNNIKSCMDVLEENSIECAFVIGGAMIYKEFYTIADELHVTMVDDPEGKGDTFFPIFFSKIQKEFKEIERKRLSEIAEYIRLHRS
tara:strand:- start:231 stop:710 length:480 start_codon:yes stop_codon:yes gene_type:complete